MKQNIEDLKIFAYLTPHPTDEFSGAEGEFLEWIPGFVNEYDEEEGVDAIYRECNLKVYDKIEELTEFHFKKSVKSLWPLLSEIYIGSMQIAIDISGTISRSDSSLAGYIFDRSDSLKGNYVFQLDLNLLVVYIKKNEKNEPLTNHENSVWEHELIHMLDHKHITKASFYGNSTSPYENFKYYLIKYREEGIADLYSVLNGNKDFINIEEAINQFKESAIKQKNEIDFTVPTTDKTKDKLFDGNDFYTYGPWLILEILRDIDEIFEEDTILKIIEKLEKKEPIDSESINEVIRRAVKISPKEFLYHYEKYFEKDFIPFI